MLPIDTERAKFHAREINLWAFSPEGTKVWCKRRGDKRWVLQKNPTWLQINLYIVNDDNADRRKKEAEDE